MAAGAVRQRLAIDVMVKDLVSKEMKVIGRNVDQFGDRANRSFKKGSVGAAKFTDSLGALAAKASVAGVALTAIYGVGRVAAQGIQGARDFGDAFSEVRTLMNGTAEEIDHVRDKLLGLAAAYGLDEVDLARAYYQALSAGITDTGQALAVLDVSAKLGIAAIGETSQGVDLLTTILEAFEIQVEDAGEAAEVLFALVADGKTNLGELGSTFGAVLARAAALGLSLQETAAAIAVLTKTSGSTAKAVTLFGGLMNGVQGNAEKLSAAFEEVGLEFDSTTIKGEGFEKFLRDLSTVVGDDSGKLQELLLSQEAYGAALSLTGTKVDSFTASLIAIQRASKGVDDALGKRMEEPARKLGVALKQLDLAATQFGVRALESFGKVFDKFQESDALQELLSRLGDDLAILAELGFRLVETNALLLIDALNALAPVIEAARVSIVGMVGVAGDLVEVLRDVQDVSIAAAATLALVFSADSPKEQLAAVAHLSAAIGSLSDDGSGAIKKGVNAQAELIEEVVVAEKKRAKAVYDSEKAQIAMNKVLKPIRTETLQGIEKEKQAFKDKVRLAEHLAEALRETVLDETDYKRLTAGIRSLEEVGESAFAARELQGLEKIQAKTRELADQRVAGIEGELLAVDRLIDARIHAIQEEAEGNARVREEQDLLVLALEAERVVRKQNVQLAQDELLAQEAFGRATSRRVELLDQAIEANAYNEALDMLRAGTIAAWEFEDAMRNLIVQGRQGSEIFGDGFKAAMGDFVEFTQNDLRLGAQLADEMAFSLSNNLGDALADIATGAASGSDAFAAFARSVATSMLQIATQALALKAIGGLFGAFTGGGAGIPGLNNPTTPGGNYVQLANGGIVQGGLGGLQTIPYAQGGPIVRQPHVALIGEGKYDEAVVPLPNGREIPVDLRGLDGGRESRRDQAASTSQVINSTVSIQVTAPTGASTDDAARSAIKPETMRQIEDAVASAIASGSNRGLRNAVQGVPR